MYRRSMSIAELELARVYFRATGAAVGAYIGRGVARDGMTRDGMTRDGMTRDGVTRGGTRCGVRREAGAVIAVGVSSTALL